MRPTMPRKSSVRRFFSGAALMLVVCTLVGCYHTSFALTHTGQTAVAPTTMLAIGDSLTVGYYATIKSDDYISTLVRWMGIGLLPNVALYGTNAPATLAALRKTPPPRATIYLLELGTNDTEAPSTFSSDYQQIISILRHANSAARFVCLGPWNNYNTQHDTIGKAIKADCPGPFVDLQVIYYANHLAYHGPAGRSTWLGKGDWFHPNNQGHLNIARAVYAALGGGRIFQKRNRVFRYSGS